MAQSPNDPRLTQDLQDFLTDQQARNLTAKTLRWYRDSLKHFQEYVSSQRVTVTTDIDAKLLRRFIVHLADRGHNAGGVRNIFACVRAFLKWYATEYEPDSWQPLKNIKLPKEEETHHGRRT